MTEEFGDFEDDDAYDTEPADPEQVAIKLHRLRRAEALEDAEWDELDGGERLVRITIMVKLLAWGRRQGIFR
jgi:hypothetical protein